MYDAADKDDYAAEIADPRNSWQSSATMNRRLTRLVAHQRQLSVVSAEWCKPYKRGWKYLKELLKKFYKKNQKIVKTKKNKANHLYIAFFYDFFFILFSLFHPNFFLLG